MEIHNFSEFINEGNSVKKIDYEKKFGKKIKEVNDLIEQAKKDEIYAIETESTWESVYEFDKVELTPTMLKVTYTEDYKPKKKIDKVSLAKDRENNFEEVKYILSWIKKTIKKGYRESAKEK